VDAALELLGDQTDNDWLRFIAALGFLWLVGALVHGSELRTDPPSPQRESRTSVTVGHPEQGLRVEDPACQLYLDSLALQGATPHALADDWPSPKT
jgi:hypothetical protein